MGSREEPIAIIGIGCRFPGESHGPARFWQTLLDHKIACGLVPPDRWLSGPFTDPDPLRTGKMSSGRGSFLPQIDLFDRDFFGLSEAQARAMDPQQRVLLETAYEGIEDAGLGLPELAGSKTGVYIGSFSYDYLDMQLGSDHRDSIDSSTYGGVHISNIANRLSYAFDLRGPSLTLDTACSGSLVAVHLACQSLWRAETELGIAGGVNLILRPEPSIALSKAGFLSQDGLCRSFDGAGRGYGRGEGAGVVLLKRLSQALADGDFVYASIRGTAVNQDGFVREGIAVPSPGAQEDLIRGLYGAVGISPSDVGYVEAHGTGTVVGDSAEGTVLANVFGQPPRPSCCYVGSCKQNIGHLEGAAGIAGLIKAALVLRHGTVPGNPLFRTLNPNLVFPEGIIEVPKGNIALPKGFLDYAGVNSFGAGGTNAHVVLQQFKDFRQHSNKSLNVPVFVISARSEPALLGLAQKYIEFLKDSGAALESICRSLLTQRSHFEHVLVVPGAGKAEVADCLQDFVIAGNQEFYMKHIPMGPNKLAFVFSGQGGDWAGMGRGLLSSSPIFRAAIEEIQLILQPMTGWSVIGELSTGNSSRVPVPILTAVIQLGLLRLLQSCGVQAHGVIGHSTGEIPAAHAAGVVTLKETLEILWKRSKVLERLEGKGKMLAVGLTKDEALGIAANNRHVVTLAAINSTSLCVLSGQTSALNGIKADLESRDIFAKFVQTDSPYHSHYVEELQAQFLDSLQFARGKKSDIELYSSVTGDTATGLHFNGPYLYANARQPVEFAAGISSMIRDGYRTFIEIGPHPLLTGGITAILEEQKIQGFAVPSQKRDCNELREFSLNLGRLLVSRGGLPKGYKAPQPQLKLPLYAWEHGKRFWREGSAANQYRLGLHSSHPFLGRELQLGDPNSDLRIWPLTLSTGAQPYLADHYIAGEVLFPGAGLLEIAYTVGKVLRPEAIVSLEEVSLAKALLLDPHGTGPPMEARFRLRRQADEDSKFTLSAGSGSGWTQHYSGRLRTTQGVPATASPRALAQARLSFREPNRYEPELFYRQMRRGGLRYGDRLKSIEELWYAEERVLARLRLPASMRHEAAEYAFHPALIDACLHAAYLEPLINGAEPGYLPRTVDRVIFHKAAAGAKEAWAYFELVDFSCRGWFRVNGWVFDPDGDLLVELQGVHLQILLEAKSNGQDHIYRYQWREESNEGIQSASILDPTQCLIFRKSTIAPYFKLGSQIVPALSNPAEFLDLVEKASTAAPTHVVFIPSNELEDSYCLLEILQALVRLERWPALYVLVPVPGAEDLSPYNGLLLGMLRVFTSEYPAFRLKYIELENFSQNGGKCLEAEIRAGQELEIRYDASGTRFVRKLESMRPASDLQGSSSEPAQELHFNPQKCYLVTGGATGVGLRTAVWMAARGARHLVLASRTGPRTKADLRRLAQMRSAGTRVDLFRLDVSSKLDVARLFAEFGTSLPALGGLIHSAGVNTTALLPQTTAEGLLETLRPKTLGALNLHESSLGLAEPLDFFLLFSSVTGVLGSRGSLAYAAANRSLDAVADLRRSLGLPGQSISWGVLGQYGGMSGGRAGVRAWAETEGSLLIPLFEFLEQLERALRDQDQGNRVVAKVNWTQFGQAYPNLKGDPRFRELVSNHVAESKGSRDCASEVLERLLCAEESQRLPMLMTELGKAMARILKCSAETIVAGRSMAALGFDSINSSQVRAWIVKTLNVNYPALSLFKGPTLEALAADLLLLIEANTVDSNTM